MASVTLLTTTWAGDARQFGMLRASLQRSALAALPHHFVVHTEDRATFSGHVSGIRLLSTADVLPGNLEAARCLARAWQRRLGRHGSKWISSLRRSIGSPAWPLYFGWQMQQISKLADIAQIQSDTVVVLCGVNWQSPALTRYVFEAADATALVARLRNLMAEPDCHYITLHSQSSGRGLWDADEIIPQVRALIDESPVASKL